MFKVTLTATLIALLNLSSFADQQKTPSFDAELTTYQYPFPVSEFHFKSQKQDLVMRYMDLGPKDADKTIVLLHGKNFAGFYWKEIAQALKVRGYRVIIPDQIGFGKSSKPEAYQYSFDQLALNTKKLLDSIKVGKYTVIGHSMGGMLATTMTYLYQDSNVEKLVLINSIGLETYLDVAQFKDTDFFYTREKNKTFGKAKNYQLKFYYDMKWEERYDQYLIPLKGWLNGPDYDRVAWNAALTYGPIFSNDIVSKFPKIKVPAIILNGTRDRTGPGRGWKKDSTKEVKLGQYQKLGKEVAALIPNSTLIELDGLGHMPFVEDYQAFSNVFYKNFPELK